MRAHLLTPRRVALLRHVGCVSVNLGIECGDAFTAALAGRTVTTFVGK